MKNEKKTTQITNINDLTKTLNIKPTQEIKTSNKKLSLKGQIMKKVNDKMHEFLITEFGEYYKNISSDVVVNQKNGEKKLLNVSGYYLMFPKVETHEGKNIECFDVCKPTTYVKGGNTYTSYYFDVIGKTTINK